MTFSNKIIGYKFNPVFTSVLVFSFYDGPESGLAIYPSGEGLGFYSIGDSRSRLFRAFIMAHLPGQWGWAANALKAENNYSDNRMIIPNSDSLILSQLEEYTQTAQPTEQYVAVGSPYLDCISVAKLSESQMLLLTREKCQLRSFKIAHQIIKLRWGNQAR